MTAPLTLADIAQRHRPSRDFYMRQAVLEAAFKKLPVTLKYRGLGPTVELAMMIMPESFPRQVLREFKNLTRKYGVAA